MTFAILVLAAAVVLHALILKGNVPMTIQDLQAAAASLLEKAKAAHAAVDAHVAGDGQNATPEQIQAVADTITAATDEVDKITAAVTPNPS